MFTPFPLSGAPTTPASSSTATVASGSSFSFGDFLGGALDTAAAFGTSLLQLELFEEQLETQAQIAAIQANNPNATAGTGGSTGTQTGAPSPGGGLTSFISDPQTLLIVAAIVVVVILLLLRRK